jgi:hypothetical protein
MIQMQWLFWKRMPGRTYTLKEKHLHQFLESKCQEPIQDSTSFFIGNSYVIWNKREALQPEYFIHDNDNLRVFQLWMLLFVIFLNKTSYHISS